MLWTILLVLVILALLGGFFPFGAAPPQPYYHGYGFGWPGGALGLVLIILLILLLTGRL